MDNKLKITIWNVGLHQRLSQLKTFLSTNKIDIMVVAKTHLTDKNCMKIPFYDIYATNHRTDKARSETTVIIKNDTKHFLQTSIAHMNIQATSFSNIQHNTNTYKLTLAAAYCPPKQKISLH